MPRVQQLMLREGRSSTISCTQQCFLILFFRTAKKGVVAPTAIAFKLSFPCMRAFPHYFARGFALQIVAVAIPFYLLCIGLVVACNVRQDAS
jgi:hypothetical protein